MSAHGARRSSCAAGWARSATLLANPEAVRAAVKQPPALHRYVENMPKWLVSAADRVIRDYAGDAGEIWSASPTSKELQTRFLAFDGLRITVPSALNRAIEE